MMFPGLPVVFSSAASAPLEYIGVNSNQVNTATSTTTVIVPTGTQAGDTVIVFISAYDRTFTTPSGATAIFENVNVTASRYSSAFYLTYISGNISVTMSGVPNSGGYVAVTLRGGSGFDTYSVASAASGGAIDIPAVTVSKSNSTVLAFTFSARNTATAMTTTFDPPLSEIADYFHVRNNSCSTVAAAIDEGVSSGSYATTEVLSSSASSMLGAYVVFKDI